MLILAPASFADEDLAAKRASCVDEAKEHIKARGNVSPQLYEFVVNRRKAYVASCMATAPAVQPPAQPQRAPRKPPILKRRGGPRS